MKAGQIAAFILLYSLCGAFADGTNYHSPVDGQSYKADWHTYYPSNSIATNAAVKRVQKQGVRLLSTQEAFGRSVDIKELVDFIGKTEQAIEKSLGATNDAFELLIQTRLTKDERPFFKIAAKGNVSQVVLQTIYDSFNKLPDYRSQVDELRYEVSFTVTKTP